MEKKACPTPYPNMDALKAAVEKERADIVSGLSQEDLQGLELRL